MRHGVTIKPTTKAHEYVSFFFHTKEVNVQEDADKVISTFFSSLKENTVRCISETW
jgi:hypothetical protein